MQLEASLKPIVMVESWYTAEETAVKKRGKRGRKKKEEEKKSTEYDWEEMRRSGIIEDTTIGMDEREEDDEVEDKIFWVGGNRAVTCDMKLSMQSTRNAVMAAGELQLQHFIYDKVEHASPSARLRVRRVIAAPSSGPESLRRRTQSTGGSRKLPAASMWTRA